MSPKDVNCKGAIKQKLRSYFQPFQSLDFLSFLAPRIRSFESFHIPGDLKVYRVGTGWVQGSHQYEDLAFFFGKGFGLRWYDLRRSLGFFVSFQDVWILPNFRHAIAKFV